METVRETSHDVFRAERFDKWRQSRRRHMTCSGLRGLRNGDSLGNVT